MIHCDDYKFDQNYNEDFINITNYNTWPTIKQFLHYILSVVFRRSLTTTTKTPEYPRSLSYNYIKGGYYTYLFVDAHDFSVVTFVCHYCTKWKATKIIAIFFVFCIWFNTISCPFHCCCCCNFTV